MEICYKTKMHDDSTYDIVETDKQFFHDLFTEDPFTEDPKRTIYEPRINGKLLTNENMTIAELASRLIVMRAQESGEKQAAILPDIPHTEVLLLPENKWHMRKAYLAIMEPLIMPNSAKPVKPGMKQPEGIPDGCIYPKITIHILDWSQKGMHETVESLLESMQPSEYCIKQVPPKLDPMDAVIAVCQASRTCEIDRHILKAAREHGRDALAENIYSILNRQDMGRILDSFADFIQEDEYRAGFIRRMAETCMKNMSMDTGQALHYIREFLDEAGSKSGIYVIEDEYTRVYTSDGRVIDSMPHAKETREKLSCMLTYASLHADSLIENTINMTPKQLKSIINDTLKNLQKTDINQGIYEIFTHNRYSIGISWEDCDIDGEPLPNGVLIFNLFDPNRNYINITPVIEDIERNENGAPYITESSLGVLSMVLNKFYEESREKS